MSLVVIVNADDFGLRPEVTDAILRCHAAGAITSTTLMVHMEDSERAASAAADAQLPVGLHLNLTTAFTGPRVSPDVTGRQWRLSKYFAHRINRWRWDPRIRGPVTACVEDQLAEFVRLCGHEPDHVDGHHHVQTCPTVSTSLALPTECPVRPGHARGSGAHGTLAAAARRVRDVPLRRRFCVPDAFFDFRQLHPAWGGPGIFARLDRYETVELMTHPGRADEEAQLLRPQWVDELRARPVGSYADLTRVPR